MGVNTDEMRAAGLAWQAAPQGSEDELDLGVCLLEFADAAADEIDELRAEVASLRAEVDALRVEREQAATVRHVWGVCEDVEVG